MSPLWLLGYYLVGLTLTLMMFVVANPRPGARLPRWQRWPARICLISTTAMFWPFILVGFTLHRFQKLDPSPTLTHHEFPVDDCGRVVFTKTRASRLVDGLGFLIPWALVFGLWVQEQQLSGLMIFGLVFTSLCNGLLFLSLFRRSREFAGLRSDGEVLFWEDHHNWQTTLQAVPLEDLSSFQIVVTDPLFNQPGLALILKDDATSSPWMPHDFRSSYPPGGLPSWLDLSPECSEERLILFPDSLWEWEPLQVAEWLRSRGVSETQSDRLSSPAPNQ